METCEIPENQLTIFDMLLEPEVEETKLFQSEKAKWHQKSFWIQYMPRDWVCGVIGIIPEYLLSPIESGVRKGYPTKDWGDQVDIWSNYVYSISQLIPYHERGENDINGWTAACEMLKVARDERKPIKMAIWDRHVDSFTDLEVLEYLTEEEVD